MVLDGGSFSQTFLSVLSDDAEDIHYGNVDSDDALEIITNDGYVFDTQTWANEWYSDSVFGELIALGYFDGDGVDEIAGGSDDYQSSISVYSADDRETLYTLELSQNCGLVAANIDADSESELIVGDCRNGVIRSYSVVDNALAEDWSYDSEQRGAQGLKVGDADNDGNLEIFSGAASNYFGDSSVMIISTEPAFEWMADSSVNAYLAGGWVDVNDGLEQAIFVAKADSYNTNDQVVFMDSAGATSRAALETEDSFAVEVFDYDFDGYGDLFLGSSSYSDGSSFQSIQLSDMSVSWSQGNGTVSHIDTADFNQDGTMDVIYAIDNTVRVINLLNETLLGSFNTSNAISDIAVHRFGANSEPVVAVSSYRGISLWQKVGNSYQEISSAADYDCERIQFGNFDGDATLELGCLADWYDGRFVIFDVDAGVLNELRSFSISGFDGDAVDFIVDTSVEFFQPIYVAHSAYYYNDQKSYISMISTESGYTLWTSPKLLGRIEPGNMYLRSDAEGSRSRMMFSTTDAMYLVK